MFSWGYVWQSQRRDSYQKGVPAWGGKRHSGPSTRPSGKVLPWLLLPKRLLKCQVLYVWKSFCEVGLSQLLCVDCLLAWNVVSSQVGLLDDRADILVCAQEGQMFKQPLAARPPSHPGDHLIYSGGLSPFSSVWEDKHKSVAPFVTSSALGAWVWSCHWQVQQGQDHMQAWTLTCHRFYSGSAIK